jgi:hypothetical protein
MKLIALKNINKQAKLPSKMLTDIEEFVRPDLDLEMDGISE